MHSPIEKINDSIFDEKDIEVYIKRDDLVGGPLHGNKFRKLKYHLHAAKSQGKKKLLTFGGAFSNHLFATAAAGIAHGFESMGIVRGEYDSLNPTIAYLKKWNMHLSFTSRKEYRQRYQSDYLEALQSRHPDAYIIPEGGAHPLAIQGIVEMVDEIYAQSTLDFDYWICPVGTGCTSAGIAQGLVPKQSLIACSVLLGMNVKDTIATMLEKSLEKLQHVIQVDAAFRGFAKGDPALHRFVDQFYTNHQILLDPIYTGKMMLRIFKMTQVDFFRPGSKILVIHTGGLQGIWGYNYLNGTRLPEPPPDFFVFPE